MCEIKIGDYVKAKNKVWEVKEINGELLRLREFNTDCEGLISCNQVKKLPTDYILSSRHSLAIAIAESGFDATELSLAAGKNKFYFGTETKESRFNKQGDLSEKQKILLFGRLEQAIKKLENPTTDTSISNQNLSLESKTGFEDSKSSACDFGSLSVKRNQDLAKTNEQAEKNFARILILICLILVLFFTVKINFF